MKDVTGGPEEEVRIECSPSDSEWLGERLRGRLGVRFEFSPSESEWLGERLRGRLGVSRVVESEE